MATSDGRSGRSTRSEQGNPGQFGLEFSSVLVSNIPQSVTQWDLEGHFDKETDWMGEPRVRLMSTQATMTFKRPSYAKDIARKGYTTCNGTVLTVEPKIEVFSAITAVIPERLCVYLPNDVIDRLERETGVQVNRNSKQNALEITGSLQEIEKAQTMLRQRFATIINEELLTGSQPQVGKYNYTDNQSAAGYSEVNMEEHTTTSVRDRTDREVKRSYQTNGPGTELAEDRSKDDYRNGRSRTRTRKVAGRSSSSSRVETSSRTVNRVKEGPADIIGRSLDNRSSGTPATTRPHTQPVLSSKSSNSSKSQSSATRKLKTPSNSILPSKTIVPGGTRAATSTPTGDNIASSSRSKSGLQGAVGGVGVPATTKSGKTKAHSVHAYKGVKVSVVHGDLTKEKVDVIVSSGGGDLKNLGGVAGAISRAGGPSIQEDCDRYKQTHGPLKTTECMVTGPGRLHSCNHVIHSCGPVYQRTHPHRTERELKDTTHTALMSAAVNLSAQSIALPAISSGTFRVPKDMCARAMLAGIMEFAETQREILSGLQDIRIVDNDFVTVLGFTSQCEKLLDDPSNTRDSTTGSRRRSSSMSRADRRGRTTSFDLPSSTSNVPAASASSYTNSSYQSLPGLQDKGDNHFRNGSSYNYERYQSLPNFHDKGDTNFRNASSWNHQNTSGMEAEASSPKAQQSNRSTTSDGDQDDTCPICMSDFTDPKMLPCKHKFCSECLATALKHAAKCPICGLVVGRLRGDQPEGRMECVVERHSSLPGYPGCGTIIIHYSIPSGIQGRDHPNPGQPYHGTSRKAYLPDNYEGQEVLTLLKEAWRNKLVFTIGTSVTTGTDDAVTWNDIHHKTNRSGGPTRYGYPDPTYLARVKEELAAKGITTRPSTA
ncbi:uncharacterized protein LOC144917639 [Branchiostoma floridae x Branchiostoma belcheri]